MRILDRREIPGLAVNYLADLGGRGRGAPRVVEFVDTLEPGVPKDRKWVMMVSTQLGCAVGCRMCDGGLLGWRGNLTAREMLAQVRRIVEQPELDVRTHPKVKVHFARMGEPSLNPAVLEALELLAGDYPFPGLMASLSTVAPASRAVDAFFDRLIEVKDAFYAGGRFQLQFSLHGTDEAARREVIPIPTWSLDRVAAYARRFVKKGDRKVTLNFAPGPGRALDAAAVAAAFDPALCLVKITPINPTKAARAHGLENVWMQAPPELQGFADGLSARGFNVILSPSTQEEIDGRTSCGQLWSQACEAEAESALDARRREAAAYVAPGNLAAKAREWKAQADAAGNRDFPLDAARAALLVVDMQEFFLDRRSPAYMPQARAITANVRRLVDAFRAAGRPVFFTVHAHDDPARDGGLLARWWRKACVRGTPGAAVLPFLEPRPGEVLFKRRYSAFTNPALEARLRRAKASQVVVAGVMTNLCVESTARRAFDADFLPFVAADATAAHGEDLHAASLRSMAQGFACVRLTDELVRAAAAPAGTIPGGNE